MDIHKKGFTKGKWDLIEKNTANKFAVLDREMCLSKL